MASTAGLVAAIPAMKMLDYDLTMGELFLWAGSVAYLGVFFSVPLREQMVVVEKLRFPTGTATAETIMAVFAKGEEAMLKSKKLINWAIFAGVVSLVAYFIPVIEHPPIVKWLGFTALSAWGFSLLLSPMMFGAGFLIGPRVGSSLLLGAILSWGVLGPLAVDQGWVSDKIMDYKTGPRGWILWPGVALMVTDALMSVLFSWKSIVKTFSRSKSGTVAVSKTTVISRKTWFLGLGAAITLLTTTAYFIFSIHPLLTLLAVTLSSALALIATRSVGETDINPLGGMGKVTQMAFGAVDPGNIATNLMAAGITSAGANQAGDMMQDLKTGYLLGADPGKQFRAQCIGIFCGIFFAIPIYKLFDAAYVIGEGSVPAPAAHAWKAMALVLTQGFSALPPNTMPSVVGAIVLGILIACAKKIPTTKKWAPSGMAMGIAFIVPAYYAIVMFFGSMFLLWWQKSRPQNCEAYAYAVASGLLAGEGLMGVVKAILTMLGVKPLFP